jgi:hypothetical protein
LPGLCPELDLNESAVFTGYNNSISMARADIPFLEAVHDADIGAIEDLDRVQGKKNEH